MSGPQPAVAPDGRETSTAALCRRPVAWWYLVYLGVLFFQPGFDPEATGLDWVVTAALLMVGTACYIIGELRPGRARVAATVAFAVLGAAGVWANSGAAVFFVYAAAFAGTFAPRQRAQRWLTGLTATVAALTLVAPIPLPYRLASLGVPLVFVWLVGRQVMDDSERERESLRLRADNVRIERLATLGERERIARDLHDLLGHTLTGVVVRAQLIRRLVERDADRAAAEAAAVEQMAREALAEVRAAVTGWRQRSLEAELASAQAALAAAGISLTVDREPDLVLPPDVEAALALAVREAVTNVVRHAQAGRCTVGVVADGDRVRLTVADDGVGFTPRTAEGTGLAGMRERVAALGGRIERRGDRGTTVTVTVPVAGVAS